MTKLLRYITNYFFRGILVVFPFVLTLYIIYIFYENTKGIYQWILREARLLDFWHFPPFVYVIIDIIIITLIGIFASHWFTQRVFVLFNRLMNKIPIIRIIYNSLLGLVSAFVGGRRSAFQHPVLVKINNTDLERVGFLVQHDLKSLQMQEKVAVFLPNSYGISGNLVIAPVKNVKPFPMKGLDAMTFVISGGVTDLSAIKLIDNNSLIKTSQEQNQNT